MTSASDPSLVDRRTHLVAGIDESKLPIRDLHISGFEGKAGARILSRDPKGPSTRVVNVPAGWHTAASGAFTENAELFVLRGGVDIDGTPLRRHGYACLPAGAAIDTISSESGALVLLWLAAPVRFEAGAGGGGTPLLVDAGSMAWETGGAADGVLRKTIATCGGVATTLVAAAHRRTDRWAAHSADEECFVLDGEMTVAECADGAESHRYRPGGYVYRPAGRWHGGAGSGTDRTVVMVHRRATDSTTTRRADCPEEDT